MKKKAKKSKILCRLLTATLVTGTVFTGVGKATYAGEENYTYVYDYWEDVQESPDAYTVSRVFDVNAMGLSGNLKSPESLYVRDNLVYLCDTGNNRILVLERTGADELSLVQEIKSVKGAEPETFAAPADIALDDDGNYYIADRDNNRVVKADKDLNYVMQFTKPETGVSHITATNLYGVKVLDPAHVTVINAGGSYSA